MNKEITRLMIFTLMFCLSALAGQTTFAKEESELRNLNFVTTVDDDDDNSSQGPRKLNPNGIVVDDNGMCPGTDFTSIQAAVTASSPGSTIQVCPGTYPETVTINKRLTVVGVEFANQSQAVIIPPIAAPNTGTLFSGFPVAAIVLVNSTDKVTLENLTVDGSANTINGCTPDLVGIYYRNASGDVTSVAVRNIQLSPSLFGCQSGQGIFVESGQGGKSKVDILDSTVHDYQKTGIIAGERGTDVTIKGNTVSGIGSTNQIAQNGIQISFGAIGRVEENAVTNHIYGLCATMANCTFTASNIIVFGDAIDPVTNYFVRKNTLGKSQVNIYVEGGHNGDISNNRIFDSEVFDGIDIIGNNNKVISNSIFNTDNRAIFVDGNRNHIQNNTINEAKVGVFNVGASGNNTIQANRFFNTQTQVLSGSSALRQAPDSQDGVSRAGQGNAVVRR